MVLMLAAGPPGRPLRLEQSRVGQRGRILAEMDGAEIRNAQQTYRSGAAGEGDAQIGDAVMIDVLDLVALHLRPVLEEERVERRVEIDHDVVAAALAEHEDVRTGAARKRVVAV